MGSFGQLTTAHLVPGTQYVADLGGGVHRLPSQMCREAGAAEGASALGRMFEPGRAWRELSGLRPRAGDWAPVYSGEPENWAGAGLEPGEQKQE